LIAIAERKLPAKFSFEIGYNLLHIKLDLLARNMIIQDSSPDLKSRLPVISLKNRKRHHSRQNVLNNSAEVKDKAVTIL
jgi:hypothetical protein